MTLTAINPEVGSLSSTRSDNLDRLTIFHLERKSGMNHIDAVDTKRVDPDLSLPDREPGAAAFDFPCREDVTIEPGKIGVIPLNSIVKVPKGYFLLLAIRSSTPVKRGLILANGIGIVDPFFCGDQDEIVMQLLNITSRPVTVKRGERLAQGMFIRAESFRWNEVSSMGYQRDGGKGYDLADVDRAVVSV
ncbi:hypothetical protein L6E12_15110 [Actinokineospora sp. PR83]|uniref:dCTP deaminase domain-containing protein n=1 Tax=Actinokineospora sp. PR83 TaxID=2884908 RepID=UPI0027E0D0B5|nr:hypothetical protein [Actinokineospora sp. PR83]MCG8917118.1 hypothetical protein [Actinokineospora sp. PR83]